ncbi:BCK1 (YJL095W) [Zygosaccharomyces parabailii]|nr:BCK1 (YJL095W) [Zygosaccharomyces parabailii]CDH15217.1 related to BCK1-Ser/thr protein kinase of the MEKK family [Zygosaccharomyces bailii ISA1307]
MTFLKKITGSGSTHSRSTSSSSLKTWSQESPSSITNKHSSWLPPVSSKKRIQGEHRVPATNRNSYGYLDGASTLGRSSAEYDEQLGGSEESEDTSPYLWAAGASTAPWSEEEASISRKLSDGSSNSLSFDKLILSWDPTDPAEWNPQRVTSWLKFHEFPESWINLFRKYQLSGQRFIRLLAYDNFVIYEKYLPQTKNASYSRFQYLLKRTMKKNVINNHIRQKSADKARDVRSSSEYSKSKHHTNKSQEDVGSSRSASESALSPNSSAPSKAEDKTEKQVDKTTNSNNTNAPLRAHQKPKSTGALYRRSFISIRGSSCGDSSSSKPPSSIRLNIPAAAHSATESKGESAKSLSPSSPAIFKRHQKSSSSESSLLNTLFGPAHNNSCTTEENSDKGSHLQVHNLSSESLPKSKIHLHETNSSSPLKQSPVISEEKSTLWTKWKRKSQISVTGNSLQIQPSPQPSIPHTSRFSADSPVSAKEQIPPASSTQVFPESPLPTANTVESENPTIERVQDNDSFNPSSYLLDKKFYPLRRKESINDTYILITKDNKTYLPLNLSMITSLEDLKASCTFLLEIYHKHITIHMTDFGCEIGSALPDEMLETLRSSLFLNTAGKLFIKDQLKNTNPKPVIAEPANLNHPATIKPKNSVKSIGSNITTSTDEISVVTSSSDISGPDAPNSEPGRRYPQTPNAYFEAAFTNGHSSGNHDSKSSNEDINYFNLKDRPVGHKSVTRPQNPRSNSSSHNKSSGLSEKDRKGTFHVLRKDLGNEIDFNKRRESPYVQPELAPKREAPKPPTSGSPQRSLSISSQVSSSHLRRDSSKIYRTKRGQKARQPPSETKVSNEETSPLSDSVVNSYTPGSSHVLVPQPYKGANESPSRSKTDDDQYSASSILAKQRLGRSDSFASATNSSHHTASPLLKRGSSKRIVSSASAADVFEENDVTFADAPELSDSDDSSDESSSSGTIIWSNGKQSSNNSQKTAVNSQTQEMNSIKHVSSDAIDTLGNGLERKMTLRPSPEVVYQNLEKFFPKANLDKPVLEGVTPPTSPKGDDNYVSSNVLAGLKTKASSNSPDNNGSQFGSPCNNELDRKQLNNPKGAKFPKRAKTIRTIAHEASEKRKQSMKLKRQNTKMWGTRTIEVTDKRLVSINKTKNSKGEYKEFAWIKGEMIGKGSFGAVFLCLNVTTGEMMAVKQVEVPKYGSQNEAIMSTVEALRAEVSTLKDLDHLNIVQYLGFEVKDSIYSLFLEYVAGGSVGSLIRMYGKFDETLIKHLTIQVLRGLSYLHSRGILHRDMKADNLLLDQDGVCKISDFGISRKSKDIYSNSEMTMRGTVFWMAPEMVDTKQGYSAKVDIWSLGCVVLEMFAGKRPWSNLEVVAAMFKIGKSKSAPPIPDDTLPLISKNGRDFLDQCFKIDPEERPTADKLSSHPFLNVGSKYDFKSTKLADFIKSNDKINSTRLRIDPLEKNPNT